MIHDIEGANPEPPRHGHVIVLSAVAATVALVMLFALLAPAPRMATPPLAASPAQGPTVNVTSAECAPGIGSSPPVHVVLDGSGRVIAAYSSGRAGRFLPLPPGFGASGWLTVPCDTPDIFAPRINRVR